MPTLTNPWALVVLIAGFFIQFIVFGISMSIGLYNVEFLKYFNTSAAAVSVIGAINMGLLLGAGPFVSILMKRFGHRAVVISGGVLSTVGLMTMIFANDIGTMCVLYGFIAGLGFCMSYIPSHVLVGLYFKKYQSLATGVVTSGSGLGSSVMPMVVNFLIDKYSWKGSLLILSGLSFNVVFLGTLLRPPPKKARIKLSLAEEDDDETMMSMNTTENHAENNVGRIDEQAGLLEEKVLDHNGDKMLKSSSSTPFKIAGKGSVDINDADDEAEIVCLDKKESHRVGKPTFLFAFLFEHFYVFTNFAFVIYFFNNICWNFSSGVFVTFAPAFFVTRDMTESDAALLLTILSFGVFVGSIVGGIVGNITCFDRIRTYIVANMASGICVMLYNFIHSFTGSGINSVFLGFFFGIILGLLVIIIIDILDIEMLSDGMGYIMFANGIGVFGGPPVAGYIFDTYQNFGIVFYKSSAMLFLAGLLMFLIPLQKKFTKRKESAECDGTNNPTDLTFPLTVQCESK